MKLRLYILGKNDAEVVVCPRCAVSGDTQCQCVFIIVNVSLDHLVTVVRAGFFTGCDTLRPCKYLVSS